MKMLRPYFYGILFAFALLLSVPATAGEGMAADNWTNILSKLKIDKKKKTEAEQKDNEERVPPVLASDPAVEKGVLPNGINYYVVTNASEIGLADFALVCKTDCVSSKGQKLERARTVMSNLARFKGRSVRGFVADNGGYALPSEYISVQKDLTVDENAVIWRFGALPVSTRKEVVDSVLLMMFDMVEAFQKSDVPAGYSTSDHAIIIAGDIDKSSLITKMTNISLMVEKISVPGGTRRVYEWKPQKDVECVVDTSSYARAATITLTYRSARTPDKYLPTSLTDVSVYYGEVLGRILKRRLGIEMFNENIPLADVTTSFTSSIDQPGDEKYEIRLTVAPEDVKTACHIAAEVIYNLTAFGVTSSEFAQLRNEYFTSMYVSSLNPVRTNASYIDECIHSYLYGSTISTPYVKWSHLAKGRAEGGNTTYFNKYVAALLNADNMAIRLRVPPQKAVSPEKLLDIFASANEYNPDRERKIYDASDVKLKTLEKDMQKVKVVIEREEAVSNGGTRWVFANGMTVVYKRMETEGLFYYNLLIRGGFSSVDGLHAGEGAFLEDMLDMYDVDGIHGNIFHHLLRANGIIMKREVTVSDMSIYGVAVRPSLDMLIKSLTEFSNGGTIDMDSFNYYLKSEQLRLRAEKESLAARGAVIDSLLSPTYRYYSGKTQSGLHEGVAPLAEGFFDNHFSRLNDGVLIIIGDMNEDLMKKYLMKHIRAFPTNELNSKRLRLDYNPIRDKVTYVADGEKPSIDVAMSSVFPFTAENYMALKIVELAIQDALNRDLVGRGAAAQVSTDFFSYPQERAIIVASLESVNEDVLPSDEDRLGEVGLLVEIRRLLKDFKLSADDLKMYKSILKNQFKEWQGDPWYWIEMVKTRVSDFKDL
ncbi:MAG: hypothetical protein LUD72_13430, partial [Bacteroidales bacterium]|nr:hypothetical protein [Bacteroidales bacterium]